MIILTKRPKGMSFDKYKAHMREQRKWQKSLSLGILYYKASEIIKQSIMSGVFCRKYPPFRGSVKDLKKPVLSDRSIKKQARKQQER